jgi:hypothetical protein
MLHFKNYDDEAEVPTKNGLMISMSRVTISVLETLETEKFWLNAWEDSRIAFIFQVAAHSSSHLYLCAIFTEFAASTASLMSVD